MGRDQGWLAEHMLILGVTNPEGKSTTWPPFPSACGKTNLSMLVPPIRAFAGWKVTTIGDDIAWIKPHADGACTPSTPRRWLLWRGPAPTCTNPNCMRSLDKNVIFTNVALTDDGDVWWEGMEKDTGKLPDHLIDWQARTGRPRSPKKPAPRPPIRTRASPWLPPTTRAGPPVGRPANGVAIDAFIFGGRRSTTVPLVTEARTWTEGVYMAATMGSETTAAAFGAGRGAPRPVRHAAVLRLQHGDYFQHWLNMEASCKPLGDSSPRCSA